MEKLNDPDSKTEKDALDELEQRLQIAKSQSSKACADMEAKYEAIELIAANISKKERKIESLSKRES